jgi:integrase
MASKAEKLPSGSYRSFGSIYINGKRYRKSFTVSPEDVGSDKKAQRECVRRAEDWEDEQSITSDKITVLQALEKYYEDRKNVLSPSTLKIYQQMRQYFEPLFNRDALEIGSGDIQPLINSMSLKVSPKTIKNRIGILLPALSYVGNEKRFNLRYPQRIKPTNKSPEHDEVRELLRAADSDLKVAMCFAAFSTLRRSEVCGLKYKDILPDNRIYIHASRVKGPDGWVYKEFPKNSGSVRYVNIPAETLSVIPEGLPDEYIIKKTPDAITNQFIRLKKKLHISCTFHDLRHYAATFRAELRIPQNYIEADGGWTSESRILQQTYINELESSRRKYDKQINDFIDTQFKDIF